MGGVEQAGYDWLKGGCTVCISLGEAAGLHSGVTSTEFGCPAIDGHSPFSREVHTHLVQHLPARSDHHAHDGVNAAGSRGVPGQGNDDGERVLRGLQMRLKRPHSVSCLWAARTGGDGLLRNTTILRRVIVSLRTADGGGILLQYNIRRTAACGHTLMLYNGRFTSADWGFLLQYSILRTSSVWGVLLQYGIRRTAARRYIMLLYNGRCTADCGLTLLLYNGPCTAACGLNLLQYSAWRTAACGETLLLQRAVRVNRLHFHHFLRMWGGR